MSNEPLWKEFPKILDRPYYLPDDRCFYARDFTSGGGYAASEGNNLISNLKKKPHLRNTPQWPHKVRAVRRFADELRRLIPKGLAVAAIPTSKTPDHDEYDSRLEDVLANLVTLRPDLRHETPVIRHRSAPPQHERDERQSIEEIYADLRWNGFSEETEHVVLIDDVVTVGRTYAACRRLIHENVSGITTFGVFWARTIWV